MPTNTAIKRRTFLRGVLGGASVSVSVPTLGAMLNGNGTAHADGSPIPKQFALWFWGNGVKQAYWMPTKSGTGWTPPESLKPFADDGLLDYVSVATNLSVPFPVKWAHESPFKAVLTGAEGIYNVPGYPATLPALYGGPKIDDVIENAWRGKTPFSSLAVQVSRSSGNNPYFSGNLADAKYNPQAMFDKMFA